MDTIYKVSVVYECHKKAVIHTGFGQINTMKLTMKLTMNVFDLRS